MRARELERSTPLLHEGTFPAGAGVVNAQEPDGSAYVALSGSVKVHVLQAGGTDVILAVLGPGKLMGEMGLADSLGRSASVHALEEFFLFCMDRATPVSVRRKTPHVGHNLLGSSPGARGSPTPTPNPWPPSTPIGGWPHRLLALAEEYGKPLPDGVLIPLRLTQTDLARLVGASRARVDQALGYFRERGAISAGEDARIAVCDEEPSPGAPGREIRGVTRSTL